MKERVFTILRWSLLAVAFADLALLKARVLSHSHLVLAGLMSAALLAFLGRLVQQAIALVRAPRGRRVRPSGRAAVAVGVALVVAGGLANWLLGLQGFVILAEGETAQLHHGAELQGFEAGPWSDVDELGLVLGLDELELVPRGPDGFSPQSLLRVWRGHAEPVQLRIDSRTEGAEGPLRFYQGAFGFAPRIVILKEGETRETLFDKVVPFLTERHGPRGIRFHGAFTVQEEGLGVEGNVRLDSLDEGMRGHATLDLAVMLDGEPLGSGSLLPGHFAELDDGYRVGFAGLQRWSEIVVSRRSYGAVLLAGAAVAAGGGLSLLLGRVRRR